MVPPSCELGSLDTSPALSCICQTRGLDQIILKAPSSSDLLGSILSSEPHLWGRGNMNILSAQIQPRHMLAQPHPSHLACSCCHTGHTLGTMFPPAPTPLARATGGWLMLVGLKEPRRNRGRGWERRGKGRGAGREQSVERRGCDLEPCGSLALPLPSGGCPGGSLFPHL